MNCKHNLIGDAAGVHCLICGKRWTPDEYAKYIAGIEENSPAADKPKPRKKAVTTDE